MELLKNSLRDNRNIYDNWKAANHDNNFPNFAIFSNKKTIRTLFAAPNFIWNAACKLTCCGNEGLMEKGGLLTIVSRSKNWEFIRH